MNKDIIEKAIKEAREEKPGVIIPRDDIYNAIFKAGEKKARREATMSMNELVNKVSKKQYQAGYEERGKWLSPNETDRLEEAMMAGIRLVVEWVEEHLLGEEYPPWQAQKKVWLK